MKNLSDTSRAIYDREQYEWRRAHHVCVKCGHETAAKGHTRCISCLEKCRGRIRKPLSTEQQYADRIRSKRRYALLVAFGVCVRCNNHDAMPGHKMCLECNLKHRRAAENKRRKNGSYPRDSYSDTCVQCGKNPPIDGKKICGSCYEKTLRNLSKANAAANKRKHIWNRENHITFNRFDTEVQQ